MVKGDVKKSLSKDEIQIALIDNFISLQKVMANLSLRFDELSTNINNLLKIFEASARSFSEKYSSDGEISESEVSLDIANKISQLFEQNKTISKGIMLIEEKLRAKEAEQNKPLPSMQSAPYVKEIGARQLPRY